VDKFKAANDLFGDTEVERKKDGPTAREGF
jgi:hypothetical protein